MDLGAPATLWRAGLNKARSDAALALVVLAAAQAEIWTNPAVRAHIVVVPFFAAAAAALVQRRRWPLTVAVVATTLTNVPYLLGVPRNQPISPLVILGIVTYTVAAYLELRRAALGLAAILLLCWVPILLLSREVAGDLTFSTLLLGTVWAGGRALRRRLLRAVALERRALQAEHEREDAERAAIARERGRIARELHDIISHGLSVMIVLAGGAEQVLARDPSRAQAALRATQETGREALADMKRLLGVLRVEEVEMGLSPQPSMDNLERLVGHMREAGLAVDLCVEGDPVGLPPGVDLCAYRVIQEALTNSVKHGQSSVARIVLRYGKHDVELDVVDNGISTTNGHGGHGLMGMRERVALYGGRLEIGPCPEGGFRVHACLPLGEM